MKVTSHECPLCGAKPTKVLPKEMMVEKTVYFACGTIVSWYPALWQFTTPCRPIAQWVKRTKRIAAIQARASEGRHEFSPLSQTSGNNPNDSKREITTIAPAHGVFPIPPIPETSLTPSLTPDKMSLSAQGQPEEEEMADNTPLTAKQVATKVGTDARTLRKFFRATDILDNAGRGGKYEIDAKEVPAIKKAFKVWEKDEVKKAEARAAAKAEKAAAKAAKAEAAEEAEDEGPTDEELSELDDEGEEIDWEAEDDAEA